MRNRLLGLYNSFLGGSENHTRYFWSFCKPHPELFEPFD